MHLGDALGDDRSAAQEVQPADPQRGHLAETDAGVDEEQHGESLLTAVAGEVAHPVVAEVAAFGDDDTRQIDVTRAV